MREQANQALRKALKKGSPEELQYALDQGADPYSTSALGKLPLQHILDYASCYSSKLDYVRPLVQTGNDFDLIREKTAHHFENDWFDRLVLILGHYSYREGDKECAAFLLANLIAHDLEKNRGYRFPIDRILAGVGDSTKISGSIKEETRRHHAEAITRNQHALVDYIATSQDPVAGFLRTCSDYPDAEMWMKKIAPVDPDQYSRPTQQFINAVQEGVNLLQERVDNKNNAAMVQILIADSHLNNAAIDNMTRSWKPKPA